MDDLGRLEPVAVREVWQDEARDFTPWLAANLDRLSEALGVPIERAETEARVGPFAADIAAKIPVDDSTVLIENQLEGADHRHLGQSSRISPA